jgi:glycosyltransferase involved in cell wall biosynthesis
MTKLRVPENTTWELLVVDNNSTDDTPAVLASFDGRLPIRRLFEPMPGVCNARNLAVKEASGDYMLWTDDDVLVEPTWMAGYVAAFLRRPSAGFFGGVIRPWFPQDPPEWLRRGFDPVASAYAARDLGPEEMPLSAEQLPYGANMAVRIEEQRAFLYDVSLGPRPGSRMRGEETDMFLRMIGQGVAGSWVPDAIVRHYIPPERQSVKYLREYYRGQGEYLALTKEPPATPRLFGKPRWYWRSAIQNEAQYRIGRAFGRPEKWVPKLRDASVAWGRLINA